MAGIKRRTDFFEVNVTPKQKKARDSEPPTVLTLAPFALIPKVCFTNVNLNTTSVSTVIIRNPSDLLTEIQLELSDDILEVGLEFSSVQLSLLPSSTEVLKIQWTPTIIIQWRGKVPIKHINGDKKFAYISIACSSVAPVSKKVTKKKAPATPRRTQTAKIQTFSKSDRLPPCSIVTPMRRETYELVKPTYSDYGLIPSIKIFNPLSINEKTVEEELEATFSSSKIFTSSPQSKINSDCFRQNREPLKEYNFNIQPTPSIHIKEEFTSERRKIEKKHSNSFDMGNTSFERDSLESTTGLNLSSPRCYSPNDKQYCHVYSRGNAVTPKKEKSFYLAHPDSPDSVYNGSNIKNKSGSFWSQISEEISMNIKKSSPNRTFSPKARRNDPIKRNITQANCWSFTASHQNNTYSDSLNDNHYRIDKSEYFDTTYQVSTTSNYNSLKESHFHSIQQPISFEIPQSECTSLPPQSTCFEISPVRPVLKKSLTDFIKLRLQKRERHGTEGPTKTMTSTQEADNSVFTHTNDKKSLYDEPNYLLHPYGVTTIADPFSRHAVHPREWLEKLELELIKWLNSLLTPPIEFGSIVEGVDVIKLWDQSTASDLKIAPSREDACKDYVMSDGSRLTLIRKSATLLARSDQIRGTVYNIRGKIDSGFLSVKDGISLFHNHGAKVKLVQMCMYYNPLWLRIGLEVIYEQVIPLHEKKIHRGLLYFLKKNFLSDQGVIEKHKCTKSNLPQGPAFIVDMNNFIILKFLTLIYFLDQAKKRKLIPYDPCLFCKDSPIKESEGILNEFIKEFLKCVGQFKKTLKALGYKLEYRQTYLDEFDYGLSSHIDLRDGVRLTRTMEIILKDPSYSSKLWTPALSRIQKIHNVQVALSALQNNGYHITSEISPTDIVNGHREKIFSLLWQILHGFLAPRYQFAARKIQYWWRKNYLKVYIKKQILMKKNIVVIQAIVRGFLIRRRIKKHTSSAIKIQRWFRRQRECFTYRREFIQKKNAAIKIQTWYQRSLLVHKERRLFLLKRTSAIVIQNYYRKYAEMKLCRSNFLKIKNAVITLQKWFRNVLLFKNERKSFLAQRNAAIIIQQRYRALLSCKIQHKQFLLMKNAAIKIQRWYRNILICKPFKLMFLKQKQAAVVIQRAFRKFSLMKKIREELALKNKSATIIQKYFQNYVEMKKCRRSFLQKRIAAISIQKWYRHKLLLRKQKELRMKQISAAIVIQNWYRKCNKLTEERKMFIKMKKAAIKIQHWYRKVTIARKLQQMKKIMNAAVLIQAYYRGYIERKKMKPVLEKLLRKCSQDKKSSEGVTLSDMFHERLYLFNHQKKQRTKDLGELYFAYKDIDLCIRFSPVLCLELSNYTPFYESLWNDLGQGLRCGPHLDIFRHGLNILIRLTKFPEARNVLLMSMEVYDGPEVLVKLMVKFIEKNSDIFCKAATVIWLLLNSPDQNARKIKNKLDLDMISFFYKKIMTKKVPDTNRKYLPSKNLDWGYFNKPDEFLNLKTAIDELMKHLGLLSSSR